MSQLINEIRSKLLIFAGSARTYTAPVQLQNKAEDIENIWLPPIGTSQGDINVKRELLSDTYNLILHVPEGYTAEIEFSKDEKLNCNLLPSAILLTAPYVTKESIEISCSPNTQSSSFGKISYSCKFITTFKFFILIEKCW